MASLERKLLDGPSAGYCSDSGEEDTGGWKVAKDEDTHQSNVMRELGPAMTGPKGVLNEFSAFREQVKQDREKQMRTLSQRAQKGMMQGTKEEREKAQASSDEDEDGLESLRARRIQEMKKAMSGKIVEVTEKEQFSQATDSCSGYLLSVLIYEPGDEACEHLTHLIKILAAEFPRTKFIRARSTLLGTSKTFTAQALPTLQFYTNGALIGNFVQMTSLLGQDYDVVALKAFLKSNHIDLVKNCYVVDSEDSTDYDD